jgi:hypothetical protein
MGPGPKCHCRTSSRCEIGRSCRIFMRENPTGPEIIMIVDRYDPMNLFEELVPKLKLEFEPELAHLDRLLDDDELFKLLKADLLKRYPNSARLGRRSTPVEVILRMLVVKRLYGWSYEPTPSISSPTPSLCASSVGSTWRKHPTTPP